MNNLPGFITRNFRLKVLCTLIALVTWVGVVYAGNPPEEETVSVAVPQQPSAIPAGFQLVHHVDDLQVRIGGARANLDAFSAASSLTVSVDWHVVKQAGVQSVPISISNSDTLVELIDPPTSVTADLDSISSETVPVTIHITDLPPPGYVIASQSATPSSVVVTGPSHELPGLVVRVDVDLGNRKTNFAADLALFAYDSRGDQINDLGGIVPATVQVVIVVNSAQATRSVAVVPNLQGTPSPGRALAAYSCAPLSVVLSGPQDELNSLDSILTTPIYLGGLYGTVSVSVSLQLPAGVAASPDRVTVTLYMRNLPTPTPSPSTPPSPTPTPSPT